jgi:hypothetical protein
MPQNDELLWTAPPRGEKRKLPDVFNDVTERARVRAGKLEALKYQRLETLDTFFDLVKQQCGYCFALRIESPDHPGWKCPEIEGNSAEFASLRRAIKYKAKVTKPCFRCHIASLGANTFHPEFKAGETTCTHENLVLPLAYAVFKTKALHDAAFRFFKPEENRHDWTTIEKYALWMSSPLKEGSWPSMALLQWMSAQRK